MYSKPLHNPISSIRVYGKPMGKSQNISKKQAPTEPGPSQHNGKNYIAYPRVMKMLTDRMNATPEELAVWVWMGKDKGGLDAYLNANELDPAPRFHFGHWVGYDYIGPLMACWFIEDEVVRFQPSERYVTGKQLIEQWSKQLGIRAKAFVLAKIAESRLQDMHPIYGLTRGSVPEDDAFPSIEEGLFSCAEIEAVEREDFGEDAEAATPAGDSKCETVSAAEIIRNFIVERDADKNEAWWKDKMRGASRNGLADCRVGAGKSGPGGSIWRPELIAAWLVGRHDNGHKGMNASQVGRALSAFPGGEGVAESFFPSDE